jgi:hypothetical protein
MPLCGAAYPCQCGITVSSGLVLTGSGNPEQPWNVAIDSQGITTAMIANNAVTFGKMVAAAPRGYLAQGLATAGQTLTGAGPHAITNCTVTFTAVASRRYKISALVQVVGAADNSRWVAKILVGGVQIQRFGLLEATDAGASDKTVFSGFVTHSPAAGSVTYSVEIERTAGTGNLSTEASVLNPNIILVEDIGGV